ncbi:MAG: transposase [Xanthomonadales bacterium]|nr:transposase [Xanthomonadales bacterium]
MKRRKFSAEFRREAIGLTRRPQASASQMAQGLGVNANLLGRWRHGQVEPGMGDGKADGQFQCATEQARA